MIDPSPLPDPFALLDASSDHFFSLDREGRFTYANRATLEALTAASAVARARGGVKGATGRELQLDPVFLKSLEDAQTRARDGERATFEAPFPGPLGVRIFECALSPIRGANGAVVGIAGVSRDVHLRKETERALELSKLQIEEVLEATDDAFFALDSSFRVTLVNSSQERLSRLSRHRTLGRIFWEIWPETVDPASKYWTEYHRCMGERVAVQFVEHFAPLDLWTDVRAFPLRDGGIAVFFRDISEQKHLDEQVRRTEEQFRSLVENLPELAWSAEADGHITFYNRRWYDYTGTTFGQMEGWGWKSVHHPEMLDAVIERWTASLKTGQPFEMEFPLRGVDGEYRWFLTRVTPLRDADGLIVRWIGTNTNIDEHRKSRAERERMVAELQRALTVRDEFLSIASHELRTPLTALELQLQGLVSLLKKPAPAPAPEKMNAKLEIAARQSRRLVQLVDGLLDVSRISLGRLELEPERVDLLDVVKDVATQHEAQVTAAGCALTLEGAPGVVGSWDRQRLEQVVMNLLSNAIKYGAGKPLEIAIHTEGPNAVLEVRDHGVGIAASDVARIFGRFERAASVKHYGGLGLGLYIAGEIVKAHHGTIAIASTPGEGARFTVTLPRAAVEGAP